MEENLASKSPSDWLREEVEGFLADTQMSPCAFGIKALNDGSFVARLRAGRNCHAETIAKVRRFIAEGFAEEERAGVEAAIAAIGKMGGYITMESDGSFALAPKGVPEPGLKRMIAQGMLIPGGDSLFGAPSQTYRLRASAP